MREKSVRTDLLLDFYGNLLTPKMRRTCESYYNDDLTLAEIAEAEGISRQGVHDTVKRAEKQLEEYEENHTKQNHIIDINRGNVTTCLRAYQKSFRI